MLTYPLIGNYGIPNESLDNHGVSRWFESDAIHASALIVMENCEYPQHWSSNKTLSAWLIEQNVSFPDYHLLFLFLHK